MILLWDTWWFLNSPPTHTQPHLTGGDHKRFLDHKDFFVFLFLDTFNGCLKVVWFPTWIEIFVSQGISRQSSYSKVSRNGRNDRIPRSNHHFQGILSFLLFLDTFGENETRGGGQGPFINFIKELKFWLHEGIPIFSFPFPRRTAKVSKY